MKDSLTVSRSGENLSVIADAMPPPLSRGGLGIPQSLAFSPKAPPLGELSPKVTERARTLTKKSRRSDSIALPKGQLIAAWRLSGDGLALSVNASHCHLSQRERLWFA